MMCKTPYTLAATRMRENYAKEKSKRRYKLNRNIEGHREGTSKICSDCFGYGELFKLSLYSLSKECSSCKGKGAIPLTFK